MDAYNTLVDITRSRIQMERLMGTLRAVGGDLADQGEALLSALVEAEEKACEAVYGPRAEVGE